ncbi:MAG: magnesium/cobalt transporter CorA [Crocinitomicaceae bacterium]|jgi:magnesium transporter|nr:magnesium/cobalt transporter CorA [Crocinitomicaceae bacterium]MBK9592569.1 magnesium/cobalt transporter CorA [Crocinitomicaceae bacterium]
MPRQHTVRKSSKAGAPPGTLVHIGTQRRDDVTITVFDYTSTEVSERECEVADLDQYCNNNSITWINVDGLHNTELLQKIGEKFNLDKLLLEDILNTNHRPKTEVFDKYLFVTLKMIDLNPSKDGIIHEQVSFVMGDGWLISFQEEGGDVFDSIRERIRKLQGEIPKRKVDFLLYRLLDTVVDNYFFVTEYFSDKNAAIERDIFKNPTPEALREIQALKRQIVNFKRVVLPLREVASGLEKDGGQLIEKSTLRYLRDLYEHIIQVNDSIDSQREVVASVQDLYLSGTSNKMNEVMKLLTIISTIFIPLTFIAGVYGMNFTNLPEKDWKYGYFIIWGVMIVIAIGMLIYFRRRKWL